MKLVTKKQLKDGIKLKTLRRVCRYEMDEWCQKYDISKAEAYKMMIECEDELIDVCMNYGYSITDVMIVNYVENSHLFLDHLNRDKRYGYLNPTHYNCTAILTKII